MKKNISKTLVLNGVNLVDGVHNKLKTNMVIIIKKGIITEIGKRDKLIIPKDALILNLSGKTVIPGLIDSHIHLSQSGVDDFMKPFAETFTKKLKRNSFITLKSGVTTVRNMPGGSGYRIIKFRDKVKQGKVLGPRMFVSGPALAPSYGYFSLKRFFPFNNSIIISILSRIFGAHGLAIDVDSKEEVIKVVQRLKKKGVDFIKTVSPGAHMPFIEIDKGHKDELLKMGMKLESIEASMSQDVLEEIVKQAHNIGLKVVVHNIYWPKGFKEAVQVGVDSIEHTPLGLLDDETFDIMKEQKIYWVPTAYTFNNWVNFIDHPEAYETSEMKKLIPKPFHPLGVKSLAKMREGIKQGSDPLWKKFYDETLNLEEEYFPYNFKRAMEKNIKIVAGVDCGASGAGYVPHGQLYKELELFVQNGMNEFQAIQTATKNAAELLGIDKELGSIEVGKIGDFVVLEANPLMDISYLKYIHCVIKEGIIVYSVKK